MNVVPAGARGNAAPIPVTGPCGHRYQVMNDSAPTAQCGCGMFAVGKCATCGDAVCGLHGTHNSGGFFVCAKHLQEAAAQDATERLQRRDQAERYAEEQREERLHARRAAAPGFPEGAATASELSAALRRLVPSHAKCYVIERKSFRRSTTVRGWGFPLGCTAERDVSGAKRYHHGGLLVTDDGRAFYTSQRKRSWSWKPGDYEYGKPPESITRVREVDVERILHYVLNWMGRPGAGLTPARMKRLRALVDSGRMSEEEAQRLAPGGVVTDGAWRVIRDRERAADG